MPLQMKSALCRICRSSLVDRQVPMIEQCRCLDSSQILFLLAADDSSRSGACRIRTGGGAAGNEKALSPARSFIPSAAGARRDVVVTSGKFLTDRTDCVSRQV